ncbi:hypothetical protein CPB84DRAFT_1763744 [Gymnopilus junonius]|uniref:Uncharacterized protein n=1 Tax=Gymnopilus junonius TaxID=109634 RepID=A0A9P5NZ89_GYMJU|nr:hypothetical protein CPB84DRAFT_1763744 [Gymnopilus junonius]
MTRAGLVILFFWFASLISLSAGAPLPERRPSLIEHKQEFPDRSLTYLVDREFDDADLDIFYLRDYDLLIFDDRNFDDLLGYDERAMDFDDVLDYTKRDTLILHRRSIWTKIKDAFSHAFSKVKEGFQKFGHIVKSGFQKAGSAIKHGFQKFGGMVKHGFEKVKQGFQKAGGAIKHGFQKFGGMVKKGFQKAGSAIKHGLEKVKQGFQTAGRTIKHGFQKFGGMVKTGFQKAGKVLKKGFQKVGNWIKDTGAKVAKFGLKVYSAVTSVASKVVKFIPVIGQPLSMAMKGASMGANIASNKIHANLGKLDKVAKGLDYVINPIGTAAKKGGTSIAANILTREFYYS